MGDREYLRWPVLINAEFQSIDGGISEYSAKFKGAVSVGEFASAAAGKGIALSAVQTAIARIYADDGGAALTAGTFRAALARTLIAAAVTVAATVAGLQGQIKVAANAAVDWLAGVWAYAEASGASVSDMAGLRATVDIPSGATIATGKVAAAVILDSIDLGGTHTGKAAAIYLPNPGAGTWDFFAKFGSATGCTVANALVPAAAPDAGTMGADLAIKIDVGGTSYYIPAYDTLHA